MHVFEFKPLHAFQRCCKIEYYLFASLSKCNLTSNLVRLFFSCDVALFLRFCCVEHKMLKAVPSGCCLGTLISTAVTLMQIYTLALYSPPWLSMFRHTKSFMSWAVSVPNKHNETMIKMSSKRDKENGDTNVNINNHLHLETLKGNHQTPDVSFFFGLASFVLLRIITCSISHIYQVNKTLFSGAVDWCGRSDKSCGCELTLWDQCLWHYWLNKTGRDVVRGLLSVSGVTLIFTPLISGHYWLVTCLFTSSSFLFGSPSLCSPVRGCRIRRADWTSSRCIKVSAISAMSTLIV